MGVVEHCLGEVRDEDGNTLTLVQSEGVFYLEVTSPWSYDRLYFTMVPEARALLRKMYQE